MAKQIWAHHPESGSSFIITEDEFYSELFNTPDGSLCVELGEAVTGTEEELRRLLQIREAKFKETL